MGPTRKMRGVFASRSPLKFTPAGGVTRGAKQYSCCLVLFFLEGALVVWQFGFLLHVARLKSVFVQRDHTKGDACLSPPSTLGPDAAAEHCFSIRFSASSAAHMCTSAVGIVYERASPWRRSHTHFFSHCGIPQPRMLNFNATPVHIFICPVKIFPRKLIRLFLSTIWVLFYRVCGEIFKWKKEGKLLTRK